jgi:YfiH family protein
MTRSNQSNSPFLSWDSNHGFSCAYSVRDDQVTLEVHRHQWLSKLQPTSKWLFPLQKHGNTIHIVHHHSKIIEGDGLITQSSDLGLGVWGSDCPGLAIVGPENWRGVAHCGWRGTASGIAPKLLQLLIHQSGHPAESFEAFIGPGICKNCYEVDQPVIEACRWPKEALIGQGPKRQLNLPLAIELQLRSQGLDHISQSGLCTSESPDHHSYRRSGKGPNQLLAIFPTASNFGKHSKPSGEAC